MVCSIKIPLILRLRINWFLRLSFASLDNSKHKRVKGKLFLRSKSKPACSKYSNSMWQPDSSDIERVNVRIKQTLVVIHEEAIATLALGKALGFKFDKPDIKVQQMFEDMISNDAKNWESSFKQNCM